MRILIWAGLFLVLVIVGSTVGAIAMIGMPIDGGVQFTLVALTVLLGVWGAVLSADAVYVPLRVSVAVRGSE